MQKWDFHCSVAIMIMTLLIGEHDEDDDHNDTNDQEGDKDDDDDDDDDDDYDDDDYDDYDDNDLDQTLCPEPRRRGWAPGQRGGQQGRRLSEANSSFIQNVQKMR
jgi:hypothetical protein